jgi:hypothetical protein
MDRGVEKRFQGGVGRRVSHEQPQVGVQTIIELIGEACIGNRARVLCFECTQSFIKLNDSIGTLNNIR